MGLKRCECCGQFLPPRCLVCAAYVKTDAPYPTHNTDHDIELDTKRRCRTCGMKTTKRAGRLGHVYDHAPQLVQEDR